ncbi:hypothetical protein BDQ17DRAFT_1434663 [Cyathus striatus]|nr:hypothetical protein BDQ17DRAFT_1434663 [Cyathus striatus]
MRHLLTDKAFRDGIPIPDTKQPWGIPTIERPAMLLLGNTSNASEGAGLPMPSNTDLMRIDQICQYIAHHGHPKSHNHITGIAIDFRFQVCRRSAFGYSLGRAMAPFGTTAKAAYLREFVFLVAQPHLYCEEITWWNAAHPEEPFFPQTGPEFSFRQIHIEEAHAPNITQSDVVESLIQNGITPAWIDHAYLYGLHYLKGHYAGTLFLHSLLDSVDDECLRQLDEFGEPPAIPKWAGWWTPAPDDLDQIHTLQRIAVSQGVCSCRGLWLMMGDTSTFQYLSNRNSRYTRTTTLDPHPPPPVGLNPSSS